MAPSFGVNQDNMWNTPECLQHFENRVLSRLEQIALSPSKGLEFNSHITLPFSRRNPKEQTLLSIGHQQSGEYYIPKDNSRAANIWFPYFSTITYTTLHQATIIVANESGKLMNMKILKSKSNHARWMWKTRKTT